MLFVVTWPARRAAEKSKEIPIVVLPTPEAPPTPKENKATPSRAPRQVRTRPSKAPAVLAARTTPIPRQTVERPAEPKEARPAEPAPKKPELREEETIARRPLPTLKELLPPITLAPSEQTQGTEGPIRLDTREPQFIGYFSSIKRDIELVWQYPEPALRNGFEGKLILEFTVLWNGELGETRLIRSSGFSILDEEAMRAVKAAAPFQPIPPWIGRKRLPIVASFEYHDDRLRSRIAP